MILCKESKTILILSNQILIYMQREYIVCKENKNHLIGLSNWKQSCFLEKFDLSSKLLPVAVQKLYNLYSVSLSVYLIRLA